MVVNPKSNDREKKKKLCVWVCVKKVNWIDQQIHNDSVGKGKEIHTQTHRYFDVLQCFTYHKKCIKLIGRTNKNRTDIDV